jgi:hypothetical protein
VHKGMGVMVGYANIQNRFGKWFEQRPHIDAAVDVGGAIGNSRGAAIEVGLHGDFRCELIDNDHFQSMHGQRAGLSCAGGATTDNYHIALFFVRHSLDIPQLYLVTLY